MMTLDEIDAAEAARRPPGVALPARARRSRTLPPCDQCLTPSVAVYTKTLQVLSDIEMSRRAIAGRRGRYVRISLP